MEILFCCQNFDGNWKISRNSDFKNPVYSTYDENKFINLDTALPFRNGSPITTSESDIDQGEYSPSKLDELLDTNIPCKFVDDTQDSCATPILTASYPDNEQSFPECQYDESELAYLFEDPVNEVTITTTPSYLENINKNDKGNNNPPESNLDENENLTFELNENILQKAFDQFALQSIDNSIQQRTMVVETEPPTNLRPRYKSDGTRQIEKSRTAPMAIKLPDLKHIELEPNQLFLLRLTLTTRSEDPSNPIYHHVNKLEYHSDDVQELNDGTVCVPLTTDDINEGKKVLPRLSIVKTKLGAYKPNLTPYCIPGNNKQSQENINENETMSVKEAKDFFKQFNLKISQIACQLLIKQNKTFHFTNIACVTHRLYEKDQKKTTNKRSANAIDSDDEESLYEPPSTSKSKSAKRKKRYSNC